MGEADKDPCDPEDPGARDADPPLTVELLADLQAGLLDDDAAARVRKRVREDPQAEQILRALNQVRRDIAALGADPTSAPDVPPQVTARISAALRSAGETQPRPGAAHSARPHIRPARVAAAVAGVGAVLAAIGVGTAALINAPEPAPSTPVTAEHITVSTPPMTIPLSQAEILGLLNRSPDYGPLGDPRTARLLPWRPRLSGVHAGAGRAADRDQCPPRRAAGVARRGARRLGGLRRGT